MKILNQEKNPSLKREDFLIQIESSITPSYEEIKKAFGKEEELTVIRRVNSSFGKKVFTIEISLYNDKDSLKLIETIPKKVKKKMEAEEKARKEAEKKAAAEAKKAEEAEKKAAEEAAKAEAEKSVEEIKEETNAE